MPNKKPHSSLSEALCIASLTIVIIQTDLLFIILGVLNVALFWFIVGQNEYYKGFKDGQQYAEDTRI